MRHISRGIRATQCLTLLAGTIFSLTAAAQAAPSQEVWGPNAKLTLSTLNCADKSVNLILIQGDVELIHPDDTPGGQPPLILVKCERLVFAAKSKIRTRATLYLLASASMSGDVDIESTRAQPGAKVTDDPKIYEVRKAQKGADRGPGRDGDDAVFSSTKYPGGRNADNGEAGAAGGRGEDGKAAEAGSPGRTGTASASVTLKTRKYMAGTTIAINTRGGNGSDGSQGGRGGDGGDGGAGGHGGKGGNAAEGRTAGNGGNGGNGGDGGDGARGGPGGDGGDGGAGGDINVLVIDDLSGPVGSPPANIFALLEGGIGGTPGLGGVGGAGGKGSKPGGIQGCGGNGAGLIKHHPDGACGQQGDPGKDGRDGDVGPQGKYGRDGPPGKKGVPTFGYVVEKNPQ